jgi:hypothetical protein
VQAFKNGREVEWKERISKRVLGDVKILDIVQMKCLRDKRQVKRKRQSNQQRHVSCCPRRRLGLVPGFAV